MHGVWHFLRQSQRAAANSGMRPGGGSQQGRYEGMLGRNEEHVTRTDVHHPSYIQASCMIADVLHNSQVMGDEAKGNYIFPVLAIVSVEIRGVVQQPGSCR